MRKDQSVRKCRMFFRSSTLFSRNQLLMKERGRFFKGTRLEVSNDPESIAYTFSTIHIVAYLLYTRVYTLRISTWPTCGAREDENCRGCLVSTFAKMWAISLILKRFLAPFTYISVTMRIDPACIPLFRLISGQARIPSPSQRVRKCTPSHMGTLPAIFYSTQNPASSLAPILRSERLVRARSWTNIVSTRASE